jgi:hypothetical protein
VTIGRPSLYSDAIADEICECLVDGISLRKICLRDDMPNISTVFRWIAANSVFCDQYVRAREAQADTLADEILDIADDGSNDTIDGKYDGDAIQRSKLRVDTRKWLAAKMQPKKYGEATTVKHADADGEKLVMDDVAIATRAAAMISAALARGEQGDN